MTDEIKTMQEEPAESRNFIHAFIEEDIAPGGQFAGMTVHTRFPPEPNGYWPLQSVDHRLWYCGKIWRPL